MVVYFNCFMAGPCQKKKEKEKKKKKKKRNQDSFIPTYY